jgi:proteasome activator subunit 4
MIPVLTSFLPPTQKHLYLPALFKLWEAFNSSAVDDRLLELAGELSEEHVSGTSGRVGGEDGAHWKDVGLWTEVQWDFLVGKGLGSMSKLYFLVLWPTT